jgi:hypothetical protein
MINDNLHICAICLSSADGTKFLTVLTGEKVPVKNYRIINKVE